MTGAALKLAAAMVGLVDVAQLVCLLIPVDLRCPQRANVVHHYRLLT